MKMDLWSLYGVLLGLFVIGWGIHGVVNRKRISNAASYILSIGQIICGAFVLAVVVLFYLTDWGEKLRAVLK
jgi:hypothetical protein